MKNMNQIMKKKDWGGIISKKYFDEQNICD